MASQKILFFFAKFSHRTSIFALSYNLSTEIYQHCIIPPDEAYTYLTVQPQLHTLELFHSLRQQNTIVILNTGYQTETAYALIENPGWEKGNDYDDLITASDVKNSRPQPDMIQLAMTKFLIQNPNEVVKVGDSIADIE